MKRKLIKEDVEVEVLEPKRAEALLGDLYHPDDYTAYVEFDICRSLPKVVGPEMSGQYFGIHPAVLSRSYKGLLHKQMNLNHALKYYGTSKVDRIIGTTLATAFPDEPEGGWEIPASEAEAPSIRVVAVIHKLADGVEKVVGEHLGKKKKWSVSIEVTSERRELAIWRRSTGEMWPFLEVPEEVQEAAFQKQPDGSLKIGSYKGEPLVCLEGGMEGTAIFLGVGMTTNPADPTAKIVEMKAEGFHGVRAASMPSVWVPGQRVTWKRFAPGAAGRGVVKEVYTEGKTTLHGQTFLATLERPVLKVHPDGKLQPVLRYSDGVKSVRQ